MPVSLAAFPADDPIWNTGGLNRVTPLDAKQALGWVSGENPPSSTFNWWMAFVSEYVQHYKTAIAAVVNGKLDNDGDTVTAGDYDFQDGVFAINGAWTFWNVGRKGLVHVANASTPYDDPTEGALGFYPPLTMQNVNTATGTGGAHVSVDMLLGLLDPMGFRIDLIADAVDEPVLLFSDYINGTLSTFARFDPVTGTAHFDGTILPQTDGWNIGALTTPYASMFSRVSKAKSHVSYKNNPQPSDDTQLIEANQNKTIAAFGIIKNSTTTPEIEATGTPANNYFNCSGITDMGTGDYRVLFNRPVGTMCTVIAQNRNASARLFSGFVEAGGASCRIKCTNTSGVATDEDCQFVVFGLPLNVVADPIS